MTRRLETALLLRRLRSVVRLVVISLLATGCAQRSSGRDGAPSLADPHPPIVLTHDMGQILAIDPEVRHEFELENRTERPIRPVRPTAHTPCCSAIGPVPESIPAGGSVRAPVSFRTGGQKGAQRLVFSVGSENPGDPSWRLVLNADVVPQWEVEPVGPRVTEMRSGVSAEQSFRLICRRRGEVGLTLPTAIETSGPLAARFVGPGDEITDIEGRSAASRVVRVTYSAAARPGQASGRLIFQWPGSDAPPRDLDLRWKVAPPISASPGALAVHGDGESSLHSVVLRSHDRPFRVLEASGPLARAITPSPEARTVQTLELAIDPSRLSAETAPPTS